MTDSYKEWVEMTQGERTVVNLEVRMKNMSALLWGLVLFDMMRFHISPVILQVGEAGVKDNRTTVVPRSDNRARISAHAQLRSTKK